MRLSIFIAIIVLALIAALALRKRALDTMGRSRVVQGGFAKTIAPGLVLYGQRDGEHLLSLGLAMTAQDIASVQPLLKAICDELHVDLVDWYAARVFLHASA